MTTEFAEALSEARADERKRCAQRLREMADEITAAYSMYSQRNSPFQNQMADFAGLQADTLRDAADELERL